MVNSGSLSVRIVGGVPLSIKDGMTRAASEIVYVQVVQVFEAASKKAETAPTQEEQAKKTQPQWVGFLVNGGAGGI